MKIEGKIRTELRTNERRCKQTKCGYYLQGGCKACANCKAEPYIINTECRRCLGCEGIQDELRWNDNTIGGNQNQEMNEPKKEQVILHNEIPNR